MSLLKRLKEKSSNEVGFSEMYEIYKEVADFEKKLIKKYNFVDYFKSYISEIRKAIKNNKKVDTNPIFSQEELNFPGKYAYLDLNCKIVNSILFKFENYFNNFANYQKKKEMSTMTVGGLCAIMMLRMVINIYILLIQKKKN